MEEGKLKVTGYSSTRHHQDWGQYHQTENLFLSIADGLDVRPRVLDIFLWHQYSGNTGRGSQEFVDFVNTLERDPSYKEIVRP